MSERVSDDDLEAILANITPGPWCYESGGGHAPNCIRGSESVQVHGWKERVQLPGGGSLGNASYTDKVCENLGDIQHGGPAYNVALICAAPDMARELLAWRSLGESPEAVRALLDDARDTLRNGGQSEQHGMADRLESAPKRPTPLEALEREARTLAANANYASLWRQTAECVVMLTERARRAAGEVL